MASAGPYQQVVDFARTLRGAGLPVGVEQSESFAGALARVNPVSLRDVYLAARATLVFRREDLPVFDDLFAAFFGACGEKAARAQKAPLAPRHDRSAFLRTALVAYMAERENPAAPEAEVPEQARAASLLEILRRKDFGECTREELDALARALRDVRFDLTERESLRLIGARRGARLDMRRVLRNASRHGGIAARAPPPAPQAEAPPAGRARRHQRLDGALFPDPPAVPPRRRAPPRAHRDVRLRNPAHAHHEPAPDPRRRHRARPRRARDRRLRRRHAHRRVPADVPSAARSPRAAGGRGAAADQRRLGDRRCGASRCRDAAPAGALPSRRLAESAPRRRRLPAAHARHVDRARARRRFLAGAQPAVPAGICRSIWRASRVGRERPRRLAPTSRGSGR